MPPLDIPRVIGHRGAAARAPENTLAGFRVAAEKGVRWVEFDVRLSADDRLVLFHDERLERTTDGAGKLREHRFTAIRRLDAGGWFGPAFAGERVPLFEEAVALLSELGLGANVEIKCDPGDEAQAGEAVAGALAAHWPGDRPLPLVSSFHYPCIEAFAAAAPAAPVGYLMEWRRREWAARRAAHSWRSLHVSHRLLTPVRVAALRREGLPVLAYTVNSARRARRLFALGVAAVFSDLPDEMEALL